MVERAGFNPSQMRALVQNNTSCTVSFQGRVIGNVMNCKENIVRVAGNCCIVGEKVLKESPERLKGSLAEVRITKHLLYGSFNQDGVIGRLRGDLSQRGFLHTALKLHPTFILKMAIGAIVKGYKNPESAKERYADIKQGQQQEKQESTGLSWRPESQRSFGRQRSFGQSE